MAIKHNLDMQRFDYTGGVQEFAIPENGLYKLEVYGASGGTSKSATGQPVGGNGGYSAGYKFFDKGSKLYICIGGKGETCPEPWAQDSGDGGFEYIGQTIPGGYNGGGGATSYKNDLDHNNGWMHQGGAGGGATHIATANRGELENYENFKSEILIVAGGGGGGLIQLEPNAGWLTKGGSGGGIEGGAPVLLSYDYGDIDDDENPPTWDFEEDIWKPTQSGGYQFGKAQSAYSGGGGGWYGGYCKRRGCFGGSGYITGVPTITYKGKTYEPSTSNGFQNGNGAAVITLIQKASPSVYLGTKEISAIYYGACDITDIKIFN